MSGVSHIKVSRFSLAVPCNKSLQHSQDSNGCNCFSGMPIEVSLVGKDNQCFAVEHIGNCSCEAFLVADRLATALGLPIYDDGNVL